MNRDFTIIFEKMDEQIQDEKSNQDSGGILLLGENLVELDELAELRRLVSEIAEPEPLSFTTN